MRLVTLRPSPMVVFSSFTVKSIRGRDTMFQGCNSQRQEQKRGRQVETFFLCQVHAQGPVWEDGLGGR